VENQEREERAKEIARHQAYEFGTGCRIRSSEHQASYRRWDVLGTSLNVGTGVFGAAAGATLLASAHPRTAWAIVAGVFGLVSGVLTVASFAFHADARASDHRTAAALYSGLATDYFALESRPFAQLSVIETTLDSLNAQKRQLSIDSIPTEQWARKRIKRRGEGPEISEETSPYLPGKPPGRRIGSDRD
jgi:hypothetical protein